MAVLCQHPRHPLLLLLLLLAPRRACTGAGTGTAAAPRAPIAMGVNGHPFSQPSYSRGGVFVPAGEAAHGVGFAQQLDEVAALAPAVRAPWPAPAGHSTGATPFYYRGDVNCGWVTGMADGNATRGALATAAVEGFLAAASARNISFLPILFPLVVHAKYADAAAVQAEAYASTYPCAKVRRSRPPLRPFFVAGGSSRQFGCAFVRAAPLPEGRGGRRRGGGGGGEGGGGKLAEIKGPPCQHPGSH